MNIHVVGVRLAKQIMTVLTCGGVEQSGKNERINTIKKYKQTKKPTKINHFKNNVFKCVVIVKKTKKIVLLKLFQHKNCHTYDLFNFCLLKKH